MPEQAALFNKRPARTEAGEIPARPAGSNLVGKVRNGQPVSASRVQQNSILSRERGKAA